ncbi:hypothetical protein OPKNFCMD_3116 [Methylobacterium crusticola]|uniref:SGNH/GDSL hydrolase family protein n=1 Tax=Methylobacterium crusticola TaxID=1697972 RepID=A0ABQ4R0Q3_9HYPH|nr:hypothetical protein [Methylobacterium crusticola]GJD50377.1 hypothetical protein OPKNFCMD_3116 [Methylobacterium crusticola]
MARSHVGEDREGSAGGGGVCRAGGAARPPAAPADPAAWRRFAGLVAAAAAGLAAAYLALALAVDPYDTGRPRLLDRVGVRPQGPRTAGASRGRDPAFTGAVVGNSHIQLVSPERLRAATGIPFVQLSMPATGPGEQILTAAWFLRHHPGARALVLAPDAYWCGGDPALPPGRPFPFWLYAPDLATYLRGLMRLSVAAEVADRIRWALARAPGRAARDGYWDYEPEYLGLGGPEAPVHARARAQRLPDAADPGRAGPAFPAAGRLRDLLAGAPPDLAVVLVFPPVYRPAQPAAGTPRAAAEAACRAALRAAAAAHPRSRVVDWTGDRPELREPAHFFDPFHYRHAVARRVEAEIAAALADLRPAEGPGP